MNPIDKFLTQYDEFSKNEKIAHLDDQNKVKLFNKFVDAMLAQSQPQTQQTRKDQKGRSYPQTGATDKQVRMIRRLVNAGHLNEPDNWDQMSRKDASKLIERGLEAERKARAKVEETEEVEEKEFTGSFNLFA